MNEICRGNGFIVCSYANAGTFIIWPVGDIDYLIYSFLVKVSIGLLYQNLNRQVKSLHMITVCIIMYN